MIHNKQYRMRRAATSDAASLASTIEQSLGGHALRWYISRVNEDEFTVEATLYDGATAWPCDGVQAQHYPGRCVALSIIPTGVGCNIGGYAGDAAPVTSLLASTVDYVITNPNAVNASDWINLDSNVVYADGAAIDAFCRGARNFYLPYSNRIGLIIEKSDAASLDVVFNVLNAVRATHGVQVVDYVITDQPIGSRCLLNASGAFVGTVDNPRVLLEAGQALVDKGANALAVTTNVQDLPVDDYARHFAGEYPNPTGGVEAIISYLLAHRFEVPVAHAPLINIKQLDLRHNVVDARGASEMASVSGLGCILVGLRRAPQLQSSANHRLADMINVNNLLAIVTPASCLGGIPALHAQRYGIPIVAVQQNSTILDVTQARMGLHNVIEVHNYAEAAGVLLALRKGISLESIARPLTTLRY